MSDKINNNTARKVKVVGTQEYLSSDGELVTMQVTNIEERDFNFTKIWMKNFIATLDLIGNKKSKVAYWIIDNLNRDNQIIMTQRQLAKQIGVSYPVVNETIKALQDANFLKQKSIGVYIINPDIVFKGTRNGRINILNVYEDIKKDKIKINKQDKLNNLLITISKLQVEANKLQKEIQENKDEDLKEKVV